MPAVKQPAKPAARKPEKKTEALAEGGRTISTEVPKTPDPINDATRHAEEDALQGHFAQITDGEHKGKTVAYLHPVETDKNGRAVTALVRFRDLMYHLEHAVVPFKHLAPTDYKGGR